MDGFPFWVTDNNRRFYNIIHITLKKKTSEIAQREDWEL